MLQLEKEKKAKFTSSLTDSFVKILYNEKINAKEIAEQLNKNPLFTEIKEPINHKLINLIKSNSPEKIQNKALEVLTEEVKIDNKENLGKTTRESKNNNIEIKELLAEKLDLNQDPQIYEILSNDTNSRVITTLMQNPTTRYNFKNKVFNNLKNNKYGKESKDIAWDLISYAEKPNESYFRIQDDDLFYLYELESSDPIYQRRSYIAKNFDDRFANKYSYVIHNFANDPNLYVASNLIHNINTPVDILFKVYENLNKGLYKEGSTTLAEELKDILKTRSPDKVKLHLKINTKALTDFNTDEDKINYYSDLILRNMLSTDNFLKYIKKEPKEIKDKTIMQVTDWLSENYYSNYISYNVNNRTTEVIEWMCEGPGKNRLKEYIATKPNLPDRIYEVLINSIFSKKDIKTKALQNVSAYYISKNHEKIKNLIYKNSDFASAILSNSHAPEDIVQLIKDNPKYNKNTN